MAKTKTKKKANGTPPKRRRGRAPDFYTVKELRDHGDSVLHMSKHVRVFVSTAIGAALGATAGMIFGDNPDEVIKDVMDTYTTYKATGKFTYKGQPIDVETIKNPTNDWLKDEPKTAVMWMAPAVKLPVDLVEHAFPMIHDGPPNLSACGALRSDDTSLVVVGLTMTQRANECLECHRMLAAAGYNGPSDTNSRASTPKTTKKRKRKMDA